MIAQADEGAAAIYIVVSLALAVFLFASAWKIYTKAGEPGWAALIPIYNVIVLLRIVGRPWWWILLLLIPLVNIVIAFVVYIDLAKSFGQSAAFGVGLVLLSFVFFPILAWGQSTYRGPAAASGSAPRQMAPPQMAPPQMAPPPLMTPPAPPAPPPPPPMPPPASGTPPAPPPR